MTTKVDTLHDAMKGWRQANRIPLEKRFAQALTWIDNHTEFVIKCNPGKIPSSKLETKQVVIPATDGDKQRAPRRKPNRPKVPGPDGDKKQDDAAQTGTKKRKQVVSNSSEYTQSVKVHCDPYYHNLHKTFYVCRRGGLRQLPLYELAHLIPRHALADWAFDNIIKSADPILKVTAPSVVVSQPTAYSSPNGCSAMENIRLVNPEMWRSVARAATLGPATTTSIAFNMDYKAPFPSTSS